MAWEYLGIEFGIDQDKLDEIRSNVYGEVIKAENVHDGDRCLKECLTLWLHEHGEATIDSLVVALRNLKLEAVASGILKTMESEQGLPELKCVIIYIYIWLNWLLLSLA